MNSPHEPFDASAADFRRPVWDPMLQRRAIVTFGHGKTSAERLASALVADRISVTLLDVTDGAQHVAAAVLVVVAVWTHSEPKEEFVRILSPLIPNAMLVVPVLVTDSDMGMRISWDWRAGDIPALLRPYVGFTTGHLSDADAQFFAGRVSRSLLRPAQR